MRTIVQEFQEKATTLEGQLREAGERYALLSSGDALKVELETVGECREVLPILQDMYESKPEEQQAGVRLRQVEEQLALCADPKLEPDEHYKPFTLSAIEARVVISKLKQNEKLKSVLVASVELGGLSIMGMLKGEVGKVHEGRYVIDDKYRKKGKIALRVIT